MTGNLWAPRHPGRAMVAVTLAVAAIGPVFTCLGSPGIPARAPAVPAMLGACLAGLQLRHSMAAARGERPRFGAWTLAVMAALVYGPLWWFTWNWLATEGLVAASALMVIRDRRAAIVAAVAPAVGTALYFPLVYVPWQHPAGWSAGRTVYFMGWWGPGIAMAGATVYGAARMVRAADELRSAHAELAELETARERLRICLDVHDLVGQSLSAVSLRGDLAARLLETDPVAAQAEIADLTETARSVLRDVLAVTGEGPGADLEGGAEGAKALLSAAGVTTTIDLDADGLPADARMFFGWALREGVTNVLRHSEATACSITGGRSVSVAWLEIVNDGIRDPGGVIVTGSDGVTGSGDADEVGAGLAERARALCGHVSAEPWPDGRFRLFAEFPVGPGGSRRAGARMEEP